MKYSELLERYYDELIDIADAMRIGVWITDRTGKVLLVNNFSTSTGGLTREEVLGKSTEELVKSGYILDESSVLNALRTGCEASVVEEEGEGGNLLATSVPLYCDGEMDLIVCVERDISEIVKLENLLSKQRNITNKLKEELVNFRSNHETEKDDMIFGSAVMANIRSMAINVGALDATVMITGESGTGKEVIANLIHKSSKRANGPFIKINCASIPEALMESELFGYEKGAFTGANDSGRVGLFELADGGTIFLDEIGELPLHMQSKLLRVLQDKEIRKVGGQKSIPIDVRIISATNRNLKGEIEKGSFREDLFYRLFVVPIEIPPLRKRKDDINHLAVAFVAEFNEQYGIKKELTDDAVNAMKNYCWPGNVRELRNLIERLVVNGAGDKISKFQVQMALNEKPEMSFMGNRGVRQSETLDGLLCEYEKQIISQTLDECENASAAARALGINKSTMSKKRKKYGI